MHLLKCPRMAAQQAKVRFISRVALLNRIKNKTASYFVWSGCFLFESEVNKMKIRFDIRKECYCFDLTRAIIFSAVFLGIAMLVCLCGGSTHTYTLLLLPRFALCRALFVVIWTLFYISFGFVLEIMLSSIRNVCREKALYSFLLTVVLGYLWFPLFFGINAYFLSFLLCMAISISAFTAFRRFLRLSRLAASVMGIYFLWLIYCCVLNFCICILN